MKIIIDQHQLKKALETVAVTVGPRASINNVLIETGEDCIRATTTDTDSITIATVPAAVEASGEISLNYKLFSSLIAKLPDAPIRISGEQNIELACGKLNYNLLAEKATDFPAGPGGIEADSCAIEASELKRELDRVLYAAATHESQGILRGVLFDAVDGKLTLVSTDTRKLSLVRTGMTWSTSVIIPAAFLESVMRVIQSGEIRFRATKNIVEFSTDNIIMRGRLFDGQYPRYEKVIPKENTKPITVDRRDLLNSVERLRLLAAGTDVAGRTETLAYFRAQDGRLKMCSQDAQRGSAVEELPCTWNSEPMIFGMNVEQLPPFLRSFKSDEVTFKVSTPLHPFMFEDGNYIHILMPTSAERAPAAIFD